LAYVPVIVVTFAASAGLAEILREAATAPWCSVNALVLVAFPPALWALVTRVDGLRAVVAAVAAQGGGMAVAAITKDPLLATIAWSAGERR
jgi:hypothetical protein